MVLASPGEMEADRCAGHPQCGVPASVLAWGCPSGPSWNPRRAAARPRPRTTSTSNTVLGMRDSTSFLTKRVNALEKAVGIQ